MGKRAKRRKTNSGGSGNCKTPSINTAKDKEQQVSSNHAQDNEEFDTPRTTSNASKLPYVPDNAQELPPTTEFGNHSFLQTSLLMDTNMIKQAMKVVHDHKGTNNSSRLLIQSMVQLLKDKNDKRVTKNQFRKRLRGIEDELERIVDDTSYKGRVNHGDSITLATKLLVLLHWAVPGKLCIDCMCL